jgi:hypothetical protein
MPLQMFRSIERFATKPAHKIFRSRLCHVALTYKIGVKGGLSQSWRLKTLCWYSNVLLQRMQRAGNGDDDISIGADGSR